MKARYEVRRLDGWRRYRFELVRVDTYDGTTQLGCYETYNDAARAREERVRGVVMRQEVEA